ncbi:MAG: hypothetical protein M5U07_00090 [Xanthobacteraceae bacterium]|nr:hypothetical protein [Xanthobacteraceae bacterium]
MLQARLRRRVRVFPGEIADLPVRSAHGAQDAEAVGPQLLRGAERPLAVAERCLRGFEGGDFLHRDEQMRDRAGGIRRGLIDSSQTRRTPGALGVTPTTRMSRVLRPFASTDLNRASTSASSGSSSPTVRPMWAGEGIPLISAIASLQAT